MVPNPQTMTKNITLPLLATAFVVAEAPAQTPVSGEPLGYSTTTLSGAFANGGKKNNIIAPTFVNPVSHAGKIASVDGDRLVLDGASFSAGSFSAISASPLRFAYYVQSSGGSWAHIVSNDASSVTLPAGFGPRFTAGAVVVIRRHVTISDCLGNNEVGLKASASGNIEQADRIVIIDEVNGGNITIIASPVLGGTWITASFADAGAFPIYPDQGLQIQRIEAGDLTLKTLGPVDVRARAMSIQPGTNLRPVISPVDVKLSDLGLFTGNAATGVAGTATGDLGKADTVRVTTNGATTTYFYSTADMGGGIGWYDAALRSANDDLIPAGSAIIVKRANPTNSSAFLWTAPAPDIR